VFGVAVLCSFWGISVRDLGSTELDEFSGSGPMGILVRSISPTDSDWGAHMPLSHVIRWNVVRILGEQSPLAWRLHSAVAAVCAALLTWWAVARRGRLALALGAGLIVAMHPILAFHSHEASNYAMSTLMGGVLVLSLMRWEEGQRFSGLQLGAVVLLGMLNDLFFVFFVAFVFLWTSARALGLGRGAVVGDVRRRFLATWGLVSAAALGPSLWFISHLRKLNTEQIIGPHADPIPDGGQSLVTIAWELGLRFGGGYVGGYLDAGTKDPWLVWAPLALLVLVAVWAWRDKSEAAAVHRVGAWMVLGSLALLLAALLCFHLAFERDFSTEPRTFAAFVVPLVLGWTGLCGALGRRAGLLGLGGLLVMVAIPTARQLGDLPDRDSRAAALLQKHHRPGDLHLVSRQVRWRLPAGFVSEDTPECMQGSEEELPDRIWLARPANGGERPVLGTCDGERMDLIATGRWRLRYHARWYPPDYDRQSGSFIPELVVALLERQAPSAGPGAARALDVRFERGLFGGGDAATVARAQLLPDVDGGVNDRMEPRVVDVKWSERVRFEDLPVGDWMRLQVTRLNHSPSTLGGLLRPMHDALVDLDPVPILSDPLEPVRTVRLPAFSGPRLRVFERALRALVPFALAIGLLVAGIRPPRSW